MPRQAVATCHADACACPVLSADQLRELSWYGVPSIYQPLVWKLLSVCSPLWQLLSSAVPVPSTVL